MPVQCTYCTKQLCDRRSLKKHVRAIHPEHVQTVEYHCGDCGKDVATLPNVHQHMKEDHKGRLEKICVYCNTVFSSSIQYANHVKEVHGLPVWDVKETESIEWKPVESALRGNVKVFDLVQENSLSVPQTDILQLFMSVKHVIDSIVDEHTTSSAQKVQISAEVDLIKPMVENEEDHKITIYLNSDMKPVYQNGLTLEDYLAMVDQLLSTLISFAGHGSGWAVQSVQKMRLNMARFSPIRGSSFLALPPQLATYYDLLNIRNHNDNNCFLYCYTAAYHLNFGPSLHNCENDSWRKKTSPDTYGPANPIAHQPAGDFAMPMSLKELPRFEKINKVQINVFRYEKKELIPVVVSRSPADFTMDLLLLSDGTTHHYVLITNLMRLICKVRDRTYRDRNMLCRNCLHVCSCLNAMRSHQKVCLQQDAALIKMPTEKTQLVKFKKWAAIDMTPYVMYFDMESLIVPVKRAANNPEISSTTVVENHLPCSFCAVVVEKNNPKPVVVKLERGPDAMNKLVHFLEQIAKDLYQRKRQHKIYSGPEPPPKELTAECWICQERFLSSDSKVLDHCHWSGKFLGWAHDKCNINRRTINFTPVFAHNLQNYDMHHLVRAFQDCSETNKFSIVPLSDQKYIALEMGVAVGSHTTKKGITKTIYEYLRFVDSYKFLLMPLDKLAVNLPADEFVYLDKQFATFSSTKRQLLKQKGFYPYSYADSFERFDEKKLPPIHEWKSSLQNFKVSVTKDQFNHAKRVFHEFECKTFGDYHDLYLLCDTLILASVFEHFRKVCFDTYKLDCCQFYTASNLTGSAFLKVCKPALQLLTEREMLDLTESMIRGGVSSIYAKRLCKANNRYLDTYDPTKESTFIICIDANNLYGGIMEKYNLPLCDFQWKEDPNLRTILNTPDSADVGYILEVDLDYPDELHDLHADYPLAPVKEAVPEAWLGEYQKSIMRNPPKSKKLLQTLHAKKNYVLHYTTLKLYVKLGLKVTEVHRVLQFKQSKWLKPYIELNTQKRKEAEHKCDQDFFKLMSNSTYGKLCESKRNRINVTLLRSESDLLQESQKVNFNHVKIVEENLAISARKQSQIYWDKPTIVGAVVLDLAKAFMADFHYNTMKPNFDCQLLYSDTDSFFYEVKSNDFYAELMSKTDVANEFDFSNFPSNHPLHNRCKERETLKFKDEMAGDIIEELCAPKPKMYSAKAVKKSKKSAKGVTEEAQKNMLHENYKQTVVEGKEVRLENYRIQSTDHRLSTVVTNKIALSAYDDKRYIMENGIDTLPFGHFSLREQVFQNMIADDEDWGIVNEDMFDESSGYADFIEGALASGWESPDMGFNQREYDSEELEDVVDFDRLSEMSEEQSPMRNPFIADEAIESDVDDTRPCSPSLFQMMLGEEEDTPRPSKRRRIIFESDSE